jgi:hypothetical protein
MIIPKLVAYSDSGDSAISQAMRGGYSRIEFGKPGAKLWCPVPILGTTSPDPSFFRGEKGRGEHYCFHAKSVSPGGYSQPECEYYMKEGNTEVLCTTKLSVTPFKDTDNPREYSVGYNYYKLNKWHYSVTTRLFDGFIKATYVYSINKRMLDQPVESVITLRDISYFNVIYSGNRPNYFKCYSHSGTVSWTYSRSTPLDLWNAPVLRKFSDQFYAAIAGILGPPCSVTDDTTIPTIVSFISNRIDEEYNTLRRWYIENGSTGFNPTCFTRDVTRVEETKVPSPESFYFHEVDRFLDGYVGIPDYKTYWLNVMSQHAFLDACDSLPKLSDNSISNILELASFIYNLVVNRRIEIPKSLQDIWLGYRYVYSTTKSDAEEAIAFVNRHINLGSLSKEISCYGQYHRQFDDIGDVICRCKFRVKPRNLSKLQAIWRDLTTYGLAPNFYVLWDMTQFSFMIDWFLPVGDVAHAVDASLVYNGDYYDFSEVVYSLKYTNNGIPIYSRWVEDSSPDLQGYYFFEQNSSSKRTWLYRAIDTLSIFG